MTGGMIVSQLGARMHYAVPRIFHEQGRLERLYTDICGASGWPRLLGGVPRTLLPRAVRRLTGRIPALPESRLTCFSHLGVSFALRRARAKNPTELTDAHLWAGRQLSRHVVRDIARRGHGGASAVYGFSGECLELLAEAKSRGLRTVVEQIVAPKSILDRLVLEEEELFPGWSPVSARDGLSEAYAARERAEWATADLVICGSEFVRQGVIACGGDPARSVVVPYGVELRAGAAARLRRDGPLKVLTIGGVGLRKGSHYVLEAARRLKGVAEFRLVGGLDVSSEAAARLAGATQVFGSIPRAEIASHYAWADVFLLPSICEGSATVVYEALVAGLPVVTTPNAGSVVRHEIDGYVTPIRDVDAIETALLSLAKDQERYLSMAQNARNRGREFGLRDYGLRLSKALDGVKITVPFNAPIAEVA